MWIASQGRSDIWADADVPLGNGGGIGCHEWINLDTGAALLLHPSAKWSQGGGFQLFYLRPGITLAVDLTEKYFTTGMNTYPRGDERGWEAPKARCISFVTNLVGARDPIRL